MKKIINGYFSDELSVLINDQLFTIPQTLMDRIFPLGDFSSDVTVTAAVRGKSIISMYAFIDLITHYSIM